MFPLPVSLQPCDVLWQPRKALSASFISVTSVETERDLDPRSVLLDLMDLQSGFTLISRLVGSIGRSARVTLRSGSMSPLYG